MYVFHYKYTVVSIEQYFHMFAKFFLKQFWGQYSLYSGNKLVLEAQKLANTNVKWEWRINWKG